MTGNTGEKKGKEIIYQDYQLPEVALSVTEKLELFTAGTEMKENTDNFGN